MSSNDAQDDDQHNSTSLQNDSDLASRRDVIAKNLKGVGNVGGGLLTNQIYLALRMSLESGGVPVGPPADSN